MKPYKTWWSAAWRRAVRLSDGPVYVSTMDYNTYAPDVYGWEAVT